ncbi:MAG: DUF839 domain-containing protein [Gemmatimonadota bacterium]|jgi:hypothetical protein
MHPRIATLVVVLTAVAAACDPANETVSPDVGAQLYRGEQSHAFAGFRTSAPAKAEVLVPGTVTPLVTAGDIMPGGEQLVGVPDGIGVWGGARNISMYLNHEIAGASRVSRFAIDASEWKVIDHTYTIDGTEGYNRLCSAEWMDAGDGFPGGAFFTGEEGSDGIQLAIDAQGRVTEMPWVGRYAHENMISVPGFHGSVVTLGFDDNGTSGIGRAGASSEVYMYVARNSNQVLRGQGQLYVFAADDAALFPNDLPLNTPVSGHWVAVPDAIAQDPAALNAFADQDDVLAFPFTRAEDGFYDKRKGLSKPAAYFYDTGRSSIRDEAGAVIDPWGSIYRLEFQDPGNPAGPTTLMLVGRSTGPADMWASPDNGDMDAAGRVMLQEDPANGPWEPAQGVRPPAIFQLQLASNGTFVDPMGIKVAQVTGGDCSPSGPGNCWETSGIVDASQWYGTNSWIFDVQAHDEVVPDCDDCIEDGQVLLMELGG